MLVEMRKVDKNPWDENHATVNNTSEAGMDSKNTYSPVNEKIMLVFRSILKNNWNKTDNQITSEVSGADQRVICQFAYGTKDMVARESIVKDNQYIDKTYIISCDNEKKSYEKELKTQLYSTHDMNPPEIAFLEKFIGPYNLFNEYEDERMKPIEVYLAPIVFSNLIDQPYASDKARINICAKIMNSFISKPGVHKYFSTNNHLGIYNELLNGKCTLVYAIRPNTLDNGNNSLLNFFGKTKSDGDSTVFLNNLYFYNEYSEERGDKINTVNIDCKILYVKDGKIIEVGSKLYKYTFYKNPNGATYKLDTRLSEFLNDSNMINK